MEWQWIIGFYHLVRLGSFTRAAQACFRTQSALSQQIKLLEAELECRLVERVGRRKVKLTEAGEKFFQFAREVLARHRGLLDDLDDLGQSHKGSLGIAAPFTTLYHLLPSIIKEYARRFPRVRVSLLDRPWPKVVELVKNGDVDFGFGLESDVPEYLEKKTWVPVRSALLAPRDHPLAGLERVELSQILKYPLILPPREMNYPVHKLLDDHLAKCGGDCHVLMESSNVELNAVYVEQGLGVCFATLAWPGDRSLYRNVHIIFLDDYFEPDHVAVVMRRDLYLSTHKAAFLEQAGQQAQPDP